MGKYICTGTTDQCAEGPCEISTAGAPPTRCCKGDLTPLYRIQTTIDGVDLETFEGKLVPAGLADSARYWADSERKLFVNGSWDECMITKCDDIDCDQCIQNQAHTTSDQRKRWLDSVLAGGTTDSDAPTNATSDAAHKDGDKSTSSKAELLCAASDVATFIGEIDEDADNRTAVELLAAKFTSIELAEFIVQCWVDNFAIADASIRYAIND